MTMNGDTVQGTVAFDKVLGKVALVDSNPEHLLSFTQLVTDGWKGSYDSTEDKFKMKKGKREILFKQNNGLYQNKVDNSNRNNAQNHGREVESPRVNSIEYGNYGMVGSSVSSKNLEDAVDLHERLGHRSDAYIKRTIEGGSISTSVTAKDIDLVKESLDACIHCTVGGRRR